MGRETRGWLASPWGVEVGIWRGGRRAKDFSRANYRRRPTLTRFAWSAIRLPWHLHVCLIASQAKSAAFDALHSAAFDALRAPLVAPSLAANPLPHCPSTPAITLPSVSPSLSESCAKCGCHASRMAGASWPS